MRRHGMARNGGQGNTWIWESGQGHANEATKIQWFAEKIRWVRVEVNDVHCTR